MDRRTLLRDLGRSAIGVVLVAPVLVACADTDTNTEADLGNDADAGPSAAPSQDTSEAGPLIGDVPAGWARVDRGFVAAWVYVRDGEAVVLDTGDAGSADAIEQALGSLGVGWADVSHVGLTHLHPDHVGSLAEVASRAGAAVLAAGAADVGGIDAPRSLQALADGDALGPLRVVATPGHTPGSVSFLEPTSRVVMAGDAVTADQSGLTPPATGFTEDIPTALSSVRTLATLDPTAVLVGHGPSVTDVSGLGTTLGALAG